MARSGSTSTISTSTQREAVLFREFIDLLGRPRSVRSIDLEPRMASAMPMRRER